MHLLHFLSCTKYCLFTIVIFFVVEIIGLLINNANIHYTFENRKKTLTSRLE